MLLHATFSSSVWPVQTKNQCDTICLSETGGLHTCCKTFSSSGCQFLYASCNSLGSPISMKNKRAGACGFEWNCARRNVEGNEPLSDEVGLGQLDLTACPRADALPLIFHSTKSKQTLDRWLACSCTLFLVDQTLKRYAWLHCHTSQP